MLESFTVLNYWLDPLFIWLFRLPVHPLAAFGAGLLALGLIITYIGELSMAGVYFLNRRHFAAINKDMVKHHNLSVKAIRQGDKSSYTACNTLANDAFGKNFFSHAALFSASIWPVPLAMGWLAFRFGEVAFTLPVTGTEVGVNFVFIPLYVGLRILFGRFKRFVPPFGTITRAVKANESCGEDLMSWGDLMGDKDAEPGKEG